MNTDVRVAFPEFTDSFEGRIGFLYTDVFGLVTTARGLLVDYGPRRIRADGPMGASDPAPAQSLGWHASTGDPSLATAEQIRTAWWKVKRSWPEYQSVRCEFLTSIRLYLSDIDACTTSKLDQLWAQLARRFPGLNAAPSPVQMGVASMSWAMGGAFQYPRFEAAFLAQDWATCAAECSIDSIPRPEARNRMNYALFMAGASGTSLADVLSPPPPAAA